MAATKKPKPFQIQPAYTTRQTARLLCISIHTVIRGIDNGELPGFKIPGSTHRRVQHEALLEYLEKSGRFAFAVKKLRGESS